MKWVQKPSEICLCEAFIWTNLHSNGVFTLTLTDMETETEIDKMGVETKGNLLCESFLGQIDWLLQNL